MRGSAESVIQRQLEAYNRHDLEAFLAAYSPDAQIVKFPSGEILIDGIKQMRENYGAWFAAGSTLHAEIANRIVQGNFVIDKERISGMEKDKVVEATAIYQVHESLITKVWFILEQ